MRAGRAATFSDINVTPLVDVMLVLLIIFMVAAPMLDSAGVKVTLPKAVTGQQVSRSGLSVTLTKDHVIYFEGEVVTLKELRQTLKQLEPQPVSIQVDRSAYVSRLVELWDLCRDAGFSEVHIMTVSDDR